MSRWQPDTRARLEEAALALYGERGFERTTVAEIATRAGLTERTFFRHFSDKREVLFGGNGAFNALLAKGIADAPHTGAPIDAIVAAISGLETVFAERRDLARQRYAIINAHPELRERELIKLATLATTFSEALQARGVGELAASLTAETGVTILRVSFQRWVASEDPLPTIVQSVFAELKQLIAGVSSGK